MSSGISFIRNLHIRIKNGVSTAPFGYTSVLKFGVPVIPPRNPGKIEVIESPILQYAQEFADSHNEIGYLSDNRLSQDAYNYAGLKLSYLKKGLSELQAEIQAKRDVVKNLEVRSLELDLIQNQALKIGIPSFQPKSHLEHIETLVKKVNNRKNEYDYIEKRENLESSLAIKFQYGDMAPLTVSHISTFTPFEYFIFVKEHPEYQKVLFQPIRDSEEKVIPDAERNTESNKDLDDEQPEKVKGLPRILSKYSVEDYSLDPKNKYFDEFSKSSKSYDILVEKEQKKKRRPAKNTLEAIAALEEETKKDNNNSNYNSKNFSGSSSSSSSSGSSSRYAVSYTKPEYTMKLDAKLKENDVNFTLADIENIPNTIDRTRLLQDRLKKNFFSVESLSQSKINVEQGRFISKENEFPSAADISLDSFSRLPTVSSIKTLKHLLAMGELSKELLDYLSRQESGAKTVESTTKFNNNNYEEEDDNGDKNDDDDSLSAESNIRKNYLFSDFSHIDTLKNLKRYNDIPINDGLNSIETDLKETYITTVLNVTDKLYTTPINEQRVLKEKFGNEFTFEESKSMDDPNTSLDQFTRDLTTNQQPPLKGPSIEDDGKIDLKNTNIFSNQSLYESFITNNYIKELEANELINQESINNNNNKEEDQKIDFQNILSNEAINIANGKSTIDPLYLLNANNNRSTLLYQNSRKQQQPSPSSSINETEEINKEIESKPSTLFNKFFEKYILPQDIEGYSKYHAKRIIEDEDRIKSKLNQELLLKQYQQNQNSIAKDQSIILDGPTYEKLSTLKLNFNNTEDSTERADIKLEIIKTLEQLTNQTLANRKDAHNALYPEYKNISDLTGSEKKISEDLIRDTIDSNITTHKYNAATTIGKEDKVDFRTLKLDPETENKFAHYIKEFRDKDAKGLISQQDAFEFTNFINFLKEDSTTSPIIQTLKSSIHMKSNNNELIDQFNAESLEKDTTTTGELDQLSDEALVFKQLKEMFPLEYDKESAINNLLYQNYNKQMIQKLENDLINAISNDSDHIPSSKVLNQTLAEAKVEFSKKDLTSSKQSDFDN
ncbi:hypothetical protein ACTFIU_002082 [Dictyostelium citrinum]